jgi:hypothetical protein
LIKSPRQLEYLVTALQRFVARRSDYLLITAGRPKNCPQYWAEIRQAIQENLRTSGKEAYCSGRSSSPMRKPSIFQSGRRGGLEVLPYRHIYQSGILFLGYRFGLRALAADVGSFKDEIVEGETGFT